MPAARNKYARRRLTFWHHARACKGVVDIRRASLISTSMSSLARDSATLRRVVGLVGYMADGDMLPDGRSHVLRQLLLAVWTLVVVAVNACTAWCVRAVIAVDRRLAGTRSGTWRRRARRWPAGCTRA